MISHTCTYTHIHAHAQYAALHCFTISSEQQEIMTWAWEVVLMQKLHPNQLLSRSMQTLSPNTEQQEEMCESVLDFYAGIFFFGGGEGRAYA